MIFNAPLFDGGSLMVLVGLIALLSTVLPVIVGGKPNYMALFTVFFIYFVGIQPKLTLTVTDYYSNATTPVAGVPYIVGVPASLAANISYELSQVISTAMSMPATGTTFAQGGLVDPLKKIYALRPTGKVSSANINFSVSLENFVRDCAVYSPKWQASLAKTAPGLDTYLLNSTALPVVGTTIFWSWSPDASAGIIDTCADVQTQLQTAVTTLGASGSALDDNQIQTLFNQGSYGAGTTRNWEPGEKLYPGINLPQNTMIASFKKQSDDSWKYQGHAALFDAGRGGYTEKELNVIQQYERGERNAGIVHQGFIPDRPDNVPHRFGQDASEYYVVKIKHDK